MGKGRRKNGREGMIRWEEEKSIGMKEKRKGRKIDWERNRRKSIV